MKHMVTVVIPPLLRSVTGGQSSVATEGRTVRQVVQNLERLHPGVAARLCEGERLKPGLAVSVNGTVSSLGLMQAVPDGAEVHFIPAIGGG
jgi:molybdopterin converting factor small subunit